MQNAAGVRGVNTLPNPAIIGFEDVIELEDEVLIIMECPVDAMDLCDFIASSTQPMLEHEIKSIAKQVIDAAIIMHKNGVFHRDIKAENILVSFNDEGPSVTIIDFGCADWVSDVPYDSFIGTLLFAPPEYFLYDKYEAEPTTVWQIGRFLSDLCTDQNCGTRDHMNGPQRTINHLSHQGNDFVSWCLTEEPNDRPWLSDLQQHPWFDGLTTP
uniref:Serine/threonine-protein kinase 1 n=2 Tax=Gouania willdenowi TaxID=441366 RepID=A0A8C5I011_GOUWI